MTILELVLYIRAFLLQIPILNSYFPASQGACLCVGEIFKPYIPHTQINSFLLIKEKLEPNFGNVKDIFCIEKHRIALQFVS